MTLEKIGPYEILDVVGRGGMGAVYRGCHRDNGERHAVKVLAPRFADEDHFRNRFESEIQALIKLDHPNIVRILSFGQEEGNLYFGMELVEGKSLFQLQKEKHQFDWRSVLGIARDVAKGLRHAHDRGIIHRDLKPGNLLVPINDIGEMQPVKITDFGIAKRFGASQNTGDNVIGTMNFMSPEQTRGEPVTVRSDLFSLGTVLYCLLSGKPPFQGESMEESVRNLSRALAPPISDLVPDVPKEVEQLLQTLMSRDPESRVPTALALGYKIDEIESQLIGGDIGATSEIPSSADGNDTFEVVMPGQAVTKENTKEKEEQQSAAATSSTNDPTIDLRNNDSGASGGSELVIVDKPPPSKARDIDYYSTVTDQVRKRDESVFGQSEQKRRGVLPVLLCLLAVVGVAIYGVYAATRPPSAESLLATIESKHVTPEDTVGESEIFLKHYPDHSEAARVEQIYKWGNAVQTVRRLNKRLSVKANIPGGKRLSEIEQQFLEIMELAEENPPSAVAKMEAMVTVYQGDESLSPSDQEVIEAANMFPLSLRSRQRTKDIERLQKLKTAMDKAEEQDDASQAAEIYQSILDLHGDAKWGNSSAGQTGRLLIGEAREKLFEILAAPKVDSPE